ncbi:MAG: alpha/beta hydrolase [Gemmatimonadales bacterium]
MPLDPQARSFLDQLASAGAPPLEQMPVDQARAVYRQLFGGSGEPEAVGQVRNLTIPAPGGPLAARIYTPAGAGPFPVLLHFHGGGWVYGDLDAYDPICRALANAARCVVVSVHYRMAPEHRFPAAPDDCYAALLWAATNAHTFDGDVTRLAVGGDSAGGTLATVVAHMARDRHGPPIVFQLLIYPVTDYRFDTPSYRDNAEGFLLTRSLMEWFWAQYIPDPADGALPAASPLRARSLAGLPAALVITAEYDPLRDEGAAYAAALHAAGVPVAHKHYDGMIHGFFGLHAIFDQGRHAVGEAAAALKAAFAAT